MGAVVVLTVCAVWWWRARTAGRRKHPRLRKLAEIELVRIGSAYDVDGDSAAALRELSSLLRRVGISMYRREGIAGLCTGEWSDWLRRADAGGNLTEESLHLLTLGPYQKTVTQDLCPLLAACRGWLRSLPVEVAYDPL